MGDHRTNNNRRNNNNNNNNDNNHNIQHISPIPLTRQQELGSSVCQWVEERLACGYNMPSQSTTPTPAPTNSQIQRIVRDCRGRVWSLTLDNDVTERWGLVGDGPQPPPTPHQPSISDELIKARRDLQTIQSQLLAKKREVDHLENMLNHPLFDTIPTRVIEKDIFF